jgi:Rne/Rng family ribonuclease
MPAVSRLGVSKRIDSEEQRRNLKEALAQLNPPDEMGVIVRTAGMGRSKDELQRDMEYLMRAWDSLKERTKTSKTPNLIYQEGDVVTRSATCLPKTSLKSSTIRCDGARREFCARPAGSEKKPALFRRRAALPPLQCRAADAALLTAKST